MRIAALLLSAAWAAAQTPSYTPQGELVRPKGYESWVFLGASIGLSYSETPRRDPPGLFHNVHMPAEAFRHYRQTGKFPEKTMFVLTLYQPEQKVAPNLHGHFQGALVATEVAVKDTERFAGGWAYFDFSGGANLRETAKPQPAERCQACHVKNGAVDSVFVQFYPVLRK